MKKLINLVLIVFVVIFTTIPVASSMIEGYKVIAEAEQEAAIVADEIESAIATGSAVEFYRNNVHHFEFFHNDWDQELVENWYYIPNHQTRFVICDENHDYGVLDYSNNSFVNVDIPEEIVAEAEAEVEAMAEDSRLDMAVNFIVSITVWVAFEVISSRIEERKEAREAAERAKAREAARKAREEAEKAEAEAIMAEAVKTLANIKDNSLVVFGKFSLEFSLERCCNYVSRDNINDLREALDNLVYRC